MKLFKSLIAGAAACMMFASCGWDAPTGISTKHPAGTPGDDPGTPDTPGTPGSTVTSPKATFPLVTQAVNIDTKTTFQEFEGFAASDCWLGDYIGRYWNPARNEVARMLFSQKIIAGQPQGIGLSMWRVNLGAGSAEQGSSSNIDNVSRRAESYLSSNGNYDWNKCQGQRWLMEQAKLNGVEKFVFFSNSPLVQYTKNGKATKNGMSPKDWYVNLKDDCYDDFAEYLATVADHFIKEGYNVTHISPVNEPQHAWDGRDQEGTPWHNNEIARIARELQKSLDSRNIPTKILIAEAADWQTLYEGNDFNHNNLDNFFTSTKECYVGNLSRVDKLMCGHSYWSYGTWADMRMVRTQAANRAKKHGVRLWQTEWSMLGDAPADLGNYDNCTEFDIAMYMSRIIHNDLCIAGCTSWSYWTALGVERYSQKNRFELIYTTPAAGNYDENWSVNGTVKDNPNLWILGNYSLFVRPGYTRVKASLQETSKFFASAWLSPDSKRLVTVYTNYDPNKGVTIKTTGSNLPGTPKAVKRYTTTVAKNLLEEPFNPADDVFLEPYSVTTVVYDF